MRVHIHRLIRFDKKGQVFHTTPVENYVETVENLINQGLFSEKAVENSNFNDDNF